MRLKAGGAAAHAAVAADGSPAVSAADFVGRNSFYCRIAAVSPRHSILLLHYSLSSSCRGGKDAPRTAGEGARSIYAMIVGDGRLIGSGKFYDASGSETSWD